MDRLQQELRTTPPAPPGGDPLGLEYHWVPLQGSLGGTSLASFEGTVRALQPRALPIRGHLCACLLLPIPRSQL